MMHYINRHYPSIYLYHFMMVVLMCFYCRRYIQ